MICTLKQPVTVSFQFVGVLVVMGGHRLGGIVHVPGKGVGAIEFPVP